MSKQRGGLVALVSLFLLAGGCASAPDTPPEERGVLPAPVDRFTIGRSVEGTEIEAIRLGKGPETVLILATIHGDEAAGTPLLRDLATHLATHPEILEQRSVILIPLANPDGFAHGTRTNAHGVDLNRNFPAGNFSRSESHGSAALSEPESTALYDLIEREKPHRIVSLHQPLTCIDYDGPGAAIARAMAAKTDLPVKQLGGRPGSLGSYAGITLGIPIITVELPASASAMDPGELWKRYGPMLVAAVTADAGGF
jgi:protein MpaA